MVKKILLVAMLVAFASAATVTTYSTAFSQPVPKPGKCPLGGNDDSQGDNDCQ